MSRSRPVVLVGAAVIDGHLETSIIPDAAILIEYSEEHDIGGRNGVIIAVANRDQVKIPAEARIIDCSGKYIIPGLINAHVHMIGDESKPSEERPAMTRVARRLFPRSPARGRRRHYLERRTSATTPGLTAYTVRSADSNSRIRVRDGGDGAS